MWHRSEIEELADSYRIITHKRSRCLHIIVVAVCMLPAMTASTGSALAQVMAPARPETVNVRDLTARYRDCSPTQAGDELVVCGRKDSARYRIPSETRVQPVREYGDREKRIDAMNTGRSGACSTAGSAGIANCSVEEWKRIRGAD